MSDRDREIRLRRTGLEWRAIEGEVVALDFQGSVYLGINPSGAALWPLLAKGASRVELEHTLVTTFGLETRQAAADVEAFLGALADKGLLEQ